MTMQELVRQGKALVMAIQGLQALDETDTRVSVIETHERAGLIQLYQRELKRILELLPPELSGEVLMAMRNVRLPSIDPSSN